MRVKVSRRLARVGAVALKNSVYVLPKNDGTTEDFEWVRREIVQDGGDATVVRPPIDAPEAAWAEYVYLRDNPRGPHDERWLHSAGCRQWFRVRRDTRTHEIVATEPFAGASR